MPKYLKLALLFTLGLLSALVANPSPVQAGTVEDEATFVSLINELRASQGLAPLSIDPELATTAGDWNEVLVNNGELSHAPDLADGITAKWSKLGENVGVASAGQTQELFDAFVASPSHYENLIDPEFTLIGVSVTYDDTGRMWTTHRFMATYEEGPAATVTTGTTVAPPTTAAPITQPPTSAPASPTTSSTTGSDTTENPAKPVERLTPPTVPLDHDYVVGVFRELAVAGI